MELASNVMENSTSVDGSSFKSDNEAINNKTQTAQRHMDRKHKHSKAHSRSKEFESERRMSSASKRTLAQMTQTAKTHDENTPMKRSDSKLYRRSSYKIANKPSTSPRISQSASSRTSVEMKPSRHLRPTAQDKTRPSTHGKGRRYGRDREPSTGSKTSQRVVDPSSSTSSQKKFPESLGETVFEGPLKSKNTFVDGKYSVDRAWKSTYVVLRGHCLCLHPDKNSQTLVVYDHPIFIGSALVDIAYDYTKRANVFRVTTLNFSEFLFEAQTSELMLDWIHMLQKQGLAYSQDFLKRKILSSSLRLNKSLRSHSRGQQKQQALSLDDPASTTTPTAATTTMATTTASSNVATATTTGKQSKQDFLQPSNFLMRFRSKSPEGRRFKGESTSPGKDHHHHHENKAKSWREKVAERFRRANSHPGTTAQGTPSNSAGPLLSPPSIQYDKVSFPSSSGEDQSEGVLGCLGVSLEKCVVSPNNEHLPLIVETCIDIIESQGLTNRGIYRVPGNSAAITTLQSQVEKDPVTLNRDHEKWNDTNAVVSLLKLFFRKLPEPLVTTELYQSFIEANHNEDKRKRLLKIKKLIHLLPMRNFQTFKSLATHLNKVSTFEKTNMMDARNLAIVFGPTLLQPAEDKNMVNMVKDMNDQCQIVESVIANYKWFFGSWEEDVPFPGVDDTKNEPVTSMESQLIEKAQQHLEMSTGGGSKKSRFTSLVSQSSNPKIPKKEAEGSAKGMTVFSVESVYWEVEKSSDSFEYQRSSKFKSYERSRVGSESGDPTDRRSNPSEKQERTSRKKIRGDFDTDKSTCSISEDGIYHSEKQVEALHPTGRVKHVRSRASRVSDVSEDAESDNFSRKDMSRRRSYNVASDALKVEGDGRAGRRVSGSSQLKPSVQSMDYSSGDSCFFDPSDDPPHVREQHRRPRKHIQAERNIRNIPASSLLQPPRTKFRSRSSQKHSKKAPFRPLQTTQQVVSQAAVNPSHEISGSGNISTNSMDNLISSGNHGQHLWKESNKAKQSLDAQTSSFVDPQNAVIYLELPPSDLLVADTATKKPDSLNDPADDLLKIASLSLQVQKNDIENSTDKKVTSSDSVFYDQNDFGQGDDKKVLTFPRKRSMSADTLFQKVGSSWLRNLLGKEEGVETQRLLPPSRTDVRLKPKHSNLFLSLHSLRSPTKLKKSFQFEKLPQSSPLSTLTSIQQRANLNVVRNLFSEIHLDPKSPGNRGGTEKRNAIKRLIRTWSSGNCFGKDVLSSPTSTKGAGGSLSYESSV